MNRIFYLRAGGEVDPIKYSLDIQAQYPKKWDDLRIYVAVDSQVKKKGHMFVGIIAYRFPGNRGAHFIHCKEFTKKYVNHEEKLRKEVEFAIEIAQALTEAGVKVHCIDFDFNENDLAFSHKVVSYAKGWALGMGYSCTVKPEEQVASRAADNLVKEKRKRRQHVRRKRNKQTI